MAIVKINEYVEKEKYTELHVTYKKQETYVFYLDKYTAKQFKDLAGTRNWSYVNINGRKDLRLQTPEKNYFAKKMLGIKNKETMDLRIKNLVKEQKEERSKLETDFMLQYIVLKPQMIEQMYNITKNTNYACFLTQIVSPYKIETKLAFNNKDYILDNIVIEK